jgi:aryl-alcohol dehydrogenase-like predicted oxidoreductase
MKTRPLGSSGIQASVVAFGAWQAGGWMWGGNDEKDSIAAIQTALDEGMNFIDTAPIYGFGYSEELVGKAIKGRRDKAVVATKCGLRWDLPKGKLQFNSDDLCITPKQAKFAVHRYCGPESIQEEIERSLKRLRTDYIDLYQTHWQDTTTPFSETMQTLLDLKKQGKIRAIGVSNATVAQMEEYRALGPLDSDQEKYSMIDRVLENEQLPWCRKNNVAVLAYSPLARGLLTGKIGPDYTFNEGDHRKALARFKPDNLAKIAKLLQALKPIAEKHRASLGQLVIAWTIAQPGLTHALVGARNPAQVRENAAAAKIELTPEDFAQMDKVLAVHGVDID